LLLVLQKAPSMLLLLPQLLRAAPACTMQVNQLRRCRPHLLNSRTNIARRHTLALQRHSTGITQRCTLLQLLQV
jgi:hypothetical protein